MLVKLRSSRHSFSLCLPPWNRKHDHVSMCALVHVHACGDAGTCMYMLVHHVGTMHVACVHSVNSLKVELIMWLHVHTCIILTQFLAHACTTCEDAGTYVHACVSEILQRE